jgi:hypothetical protein
MSAHLDGPPRSTLGAAMVAVRAQLAGAGYGRDPNTNPGGIEILIGERYLKEEGVPPRLVMVRTTGKSGGALRVGDGNVASWAQGFTAYLWGAETADDATRYDAQDNLVDQVVNAIRKTMPGRAELSTINPLVETNIVTFGEELQLLVTYKRSVPRDGRLWAVPTDAQPTLDAMRPQGDLGTTFVVTPTTDGSR